MHTRTNKKYLKKKKSELGMMLPDYAKTEGLGQDDQGFDVNLS